MVSNVEALDALIAQLLKPRDRRSRSGLPHDAYDQAIAGLMEEIRGIKAALETKLPRPSTLEMKMDPLPGLLEQLGSPPK